MKEIEDYLPKAKVKKLYETLENERANLDQERMIMEEQVKDNDYGEKTVRSLLEKVKGIFINPLAFWQLGNEEMRQLLLVVRFGDKLYHTKNKGFRTKENTGLHQYFKGICGWLVPSKAIDGSKPEPLYASCSDMRDVIFTNAGNIAKLHDWYMYALHGG